MIAVDLFEFNSAKIEFKSANDTLIIGLLSFDNVKDCDFKLSFMIIKLENRNKNQNRIYLLQST